LAVGTLNLHKSAIISILSIRDTTFESFSNSKLLSRLLKGAFNLKPRSKPRLTWDVDVLLTCLKNWGPNSSLSIRQLFLKSLGLLALVTACRVSELSSLSRHFRQSPSGWTLDFNKLKKTSSIKNDSLKIFVNYFHDDV
jgi:hypothetical protein